MSVYSMTGFSKSECEDESSVIIVEIKSVNNRYKDLKLRIPQTLAPLELSIRKQIEKKFKRGSFDLSINLKSKKTLTESSKLDSVKITNYLADLKKILQDDFSLVHLSALDFYRNDFFINSEEIELGESLKSLVDSALNQAFDGLMKSRAQEGEELVIKILEHLNTFEDRLNKIIKLKDLMPEILKEKFELKFLERLKDLKVDEGRLLQEVLYYLEKLEIAEETNRLKIHIEKLKNMFKQGGELGRQVDFLLQELGRETNTIGSKSSHIEISSSIIEMKVQLEKIREQALNLE